MKSNCFLVLIACLLLSCKNDTASQSINTDLDKKGNLSFSKDDIERIKSTSYNHINRFTLNKDEFLNIHFTLEKPLIQSLQKVAPNLSEDELLEKGNFQFSFLVDGKKVYLENLNKGAGLKASKTEQLNHTIRLIAPNKLDYWGWFMWLKFMKLGGGQDELSEGNHSLTIEVRPYVRVDKLEVGSLLAKGSIRIEVAKIKIDESLVPIQKILPNSDWDISTGYVDTQKIEALNRKIAEDRFENINGLVVIKDGKLLLEEYFNGESRDSLHDPRSVGKSIASTILGIAIEEEFIKNENKALKSFYNLNSYNNHSIKKESVTLKSLLTMSSGFDGDDSNYSSLGNEENMYPTNDWVKFTLDLPMKKETNIGEEFAYFTAGVVVLGDIIHKSVPNGLVSYADKKLFKPLGITNYEWEYTPQNVGNTAGGIRLRALDFAKYGQLYKNKGLWNGKQILNEQWVEKSLGKQIKQSLDEGYYGYLFWNKTYKVNNKEYEVSYCSGNGGNKVFIFKEIPFVVVITASAYNNPNAHSNVDKMMMEYILPAIIN
ncbi:serine hydrolase [Tenacibaculum sp. SG-28]|uniref:serine hydrolase domain-containing protein n=1 Tax=Tenacibaculum sp. SG-28 TaxID=754426 RepID=UPI000CF39A1C|nr:serine hydrolase [Tenacibaculum sp. SG-28]PQJ18930.1 serine hydrolase [Tenacibaculum sp. SG-28]